MTTQKPAAKPTQKPAAEVLEHDAWRYGPDGEAQLICSGETVPAGWKDTPAAFEKTGDDNG